MINLPNRCGECFQKTLNGCDAFYSINKDAGNAMARIV